MANTPTPAQRRQEHFFDGLRREGLRLERIRHFKEGRIKPFKKMQPTRLLKDEASGKWKIGLGSW